MICFLLFLLSSEASLKSKINSGLQYTSQVFLIMDWATYFGKKWCSHTCRSCERHIEKKKLTEKWNREKMKNVRWCDTENKIKSEESDVGI